MPNRKMSDVVFIFMVNDSSPLPDKTFVCTAKQIERLFDFLHQFRPGAAINVKDATEASVITILQNVRVTVY